MSQGRKSPYLVDLNHEEKGRLEYLLRSTTIQAGLARRARMVLLRAEGLSLTEIAERVGVGRLVVRKWIKRFIKDRLKGLGDKPGRGRKPVFSPGSSHASGSISLRATG
jgi:DNA-directed RNA polymerase specialized sigma24 family protein